MISFAGFWEYYPKKTNKTKSEVSWNRLSNADKDAAYYDVQTRFINVEKQYVPHATTYINGKRWNDEKVTNETNSRTPETRRDHTARIIGYIDERIKSIRAKDPVSFKAFLSDMEI